MTESQAREVRRALQEMQASVIRITETFIGRDNHPLFNDKASPITMITVTMIEGVSAQINHLDEILEQYMGFFGMED